MSLFNRYKPDNNGNSYAKKKVALKLKVDKCIFEGCSRLLSANEKMFSDYCFKHQQQINQNQNKNI